MAQIQATMLRPSKKLGAAIKKAKQVRFTIYGMSVLEFFLFSGHEILHHSVLAPGNNATTWLSFVISNIAVSLIMVETIQIIQFAKGLFNGDNLIHYYEKKTKKDELEEMIHYYTYHVRANSFVVRDDFLLLISSALIEKAFNHLNRPLDPEFHF